MGSYSIELLNIQIEVKLQMRKYLFLKKLSFITKIFSNNNNSNKSNNYKAVAKKGGDIAFSH